MHYPRCGSKLRVWTCVSVTSRASQAVVNLGCTRTCSPSLRRCFCTGLPAMDGWVCSISSSSHWQASSLPSFKLHPTLSSSPTCSTPCFIAKHVLEEDHVPGAPTQLPPYLSPDLFTIIRKVKTDTPLNIVTMSERD
jgi:hypothetical protein